MLGTLPSELHAPVAVCASVALACWLLSVITREYSWVDRVWSVVPPVYVGLFAADVGWSDARLNLMTFLTTLWAIRLTFNFARKGGYAPGGEDYRWGVLRQRMSPVAYHFFNLMFIAGYQNLLLLLIALPAWAVWEHPGPPLGLVDFILTGLFLFFLVMEFVADQQQWAFHVAKKARRARGEAVGKGFLDEGLWRYSRHPNFFAEQAQWWVVYGFGWAAGAPLVNKTIAGAALLTMLFWGSRRFTEKLTAEKYTQYAGYQLRTSATLPWWPSSKRDG